MRDRRRLRRLRVRVHRHHSLAMLLRELEQAGVRAAFLNAINAAMERSKELARGDE